MFLSLKRNVSSAIMTGLLLFLFVLFLYLTRASYNLYQEYQKFYRYNAYLSNINSILERTEVFQKQGEDLGAEMKWMRSALSSSLKLNLEHKDD